MKFEILKDVPDSLKKIKENIATVVFRTKQVYTFDDTVWKTVQKIQESGRFPYFAGLLLGDIAKGRYYPSLSAGEYINLKNIVIKDSAVPKFTHGNDVNFMDIVEKNVKPDDLARVVNEEKEFLGYGIIRRKRVENIKDIGEFLREELAKKKNH